MFHPDNIYNADEIVLFYHAMPDGSLCHKHESLSGAKKAMNCMTMLCCVNMSGSDRKNR